MKRAAVLAWILAFAGCSSPPPAARPAHAAVLVQVGPGGDAGQNDASACGIPVQTFAVPAEGGTPWYVVGDGDEDPGGAAIHVRCSVRAQGGAFGVDTELTTQGGLRAAVTGAMSRASSEAQALFEQNGVTFTSQRPCSVDFSAAGGMDIQPGRVWAIVTCPRATDGRGHTCLASAEFLFVDCQQ